VLERREEIMKSKREHAEYHLVKRQISRKDRQDHLIFLKNLIMRKVRNGNLMAHMVLVKAVSIMNEHMIKRHKDNIMVVRTRAAINKVAKYSFRYIHRKPGFRLNNVRH
jgi:hypothetical protein